MLLRTGSTCAHWTTASPGRCRTARASVMVRMHSCRLMPTQLRTLSWTTRSACCTVTMNAGCTLAGMVTDVSGTVYGRAAGVPYPAVRGSSPWAGAAAARTRSIVAVPMHGRRRGAPGARTSSVQTFMAAARQPSVVGSSVPSRLRSARWPTPRQCRWTCRDRWPDPPGSASASRALCHPTRASRRCASGTAAPRRAPGSPSPDRRP